jgi:FkbM family methyltransferase
LPAGRELARRVWLAAVARGIRVPESPANRYQEFSQMAKILDELRINLVLDVGANTGQYASDLRALGYEGMICSFEPVERSFKRLEERFRSDPKWSGQRLALGDRAAEMTINVIPELTEMSSLLAPRGDRTGVEEETVQVARLDEMFAELAGGVSDPRVFLKMDTQGYDLAVFEGAAGCLDSVMGLESELSVRPLYEGMRSYTEALSTYEAAGFTLAHVSVVSRTAEGELAELNCFMKRADGADA